MVDLSRAQQSVLIQLYRASCVLYDNTLSRYKDLNCRNKALKAMQAMFLQMTEIRLEINDLKTKLQSFRTSVSREMNKVARSAKTASASGEDYIPSYAHRHELQFLTKFIKKRDAKFNVEDHQSSSDFITVKEAADNSLVWVAHMANIPIQPLDSQPPPSPPPPPPPLSPPSQFPTSSLIEAGSVASQQLQPYLNQPIPLYALNLQFVNAMQSASQRNHRGPPVITEDPYDEDTFPTPDDCDDDDDDLASPDSAHESLHDIEIIHNDIDDEDDEDSSADMPPHNDPHNHDTSSSQGNNILHEDPGLPQFTVSSPKDATARVTASEKLTRKRKSSADMTRAALESALNTFREISREEMRAFNEAENERWEKWMQLERERQAHERKQDKMMFSFLQKAFGCSGGGGGGERENCSATTNEGASNDDNASV
ncbi:hypothetical protein ACOMHN_005097 [Nucella lapillus]